MVGARQHEGGRPPPLTITYGAGGLAAEALNGEVIRAAVIVDGQDGMSHRTCAENRHNMHMRRAYAASWHYCAIRASIAAVNAGQFRQDTQWQPDSVYIQCSSFFPPFPPSLYLLTFILSSQSFLALSLYLILFDSVIHLSLPIF